MKLGIFYDGNFFRLLSDYFQHEHPVKAQLNILGFQDLLRWHLTDDPDRARVGEVHYFAGREEGSRNPFDAPLAQAGVERHDFPLQHGKEVGVDVSLALWAFRRSTAAHLDAVVLVTTDGDLYPLVEALHEQGIRVVVPSVDLTTSERVMRTSSFLKSTAECPELLPLMVKYDQSQSGLVPLFMSGGAPAETALGRSQGTVTRWQGTAGFITDTSGGSWFVSRDDLPEGREELVVGARVTFSGSPKPRPGKKYPQAVSLRLV